MLQPIILAGGSGQRLWPLSRKSTPKPFLPLDGASSKTLYQMTLERLSTCNNTLPPLVICQEEHRFLAGEQARNAGIELSSIILEPCPRGTAPAAIISCLHTRNTFPKADSVIILPADHIFHDHSDFAITISKAHQVAKEEKKIVTIGIKPQYPETGYGYIKSGESIGNYEAMYIDTFIEKPKLEKAKMFCSDEKYLWNAGIFVSSIETLLSQASDFEAASVESCTEALKSLTKDFDFIRPDLEYFGKCKDISIDHGIMEKTNVGAVVKLNSKWEDLGSWQAIWEHNPKDEDNNVTVGNIITSDSKNNYINSKNKLVATHGIESLIIVDSDDALLVTTKDKSKDLKNLISKVLAKSPDKVYNHKRVERPWGFFESILVSGTYQVKRLSIFPGSSISLQLHNHREEHWIVVSGTAKVVRGTDTYYLKKGQSTHIPIRTKHRLENIGEEELEIIEVQTGSYLGEDDIVRFEDRYGRITKENLSHA